ncbi:MAG: glycosyltransferase [Nanoarchaeota archaeon]
MVKVSIVIPVYKPDEEVLNKVREMLKKQTVRAEVVENWNMPEAKSMNTGIKKAKGDIIVTLDQDCVPENEFWLETLIKPLKNKKISATVSDLYLPEDYWKKYPFFTRVLTVSERVVKYSGMDARGCAYRRETLKKTGLFNENPDVIAIEADLYHNLKREGEICHPGCMIYHMHPFDNWKKMKLDYKYSFSNGQIVRSEGLNAHVFFRKIMRGIPLLGLGSLFYRFQFKKYFYLFPFFAVFSIVQHINCVYGFWRGFFSFKKK